MVSSVLRRHTTVCVRRSKRKLELKHNKFEFKLQLAAGAEGAGGGGQSPVVRERSGSGFGLLDASSSNREIAALRTRSTIPGANNAVGGLII